MSKLANENGLAPRAEEIEGVVRRPDGSPDIAAYARLAHRERASAMMALASDAMRLVREMVSAARASLAPAARSGPASGKHPAQVGR
ncbi:MAG: hypothetical protein Q7J60_08945 [Bradyrhizobium sp.]|nr:hypothetical protein [Bradyrhizobium sp.]